MEGEVVPAENLGARHGRGRNGKSWAGIAPRHRPAALLGASGVIRRNQAPCEALPQPRYTTRAACPWGKLVDSNDLVMFGLLALASLSAGVIAYLLVAPYLADDRASQRLQAASESKVRRMSAKQQAEVANSRRRQVADTLKDIEQRQKQREKVTLRLRLQRAGLSIDARMFWLASAVTGAVVAAIVWILAPGLPFIVALLVGFAGMFGLPRWVLARMTKRRQTKFTDEFANAIDIIVRA